jgi:hypothetical protein
MGRSERSAITHAFKKPIVGIEISRIRVTKFENLWTSFYTLHLFTMSNGVPSQISLENAVVAQDEMGRPFIIVREYLSPFSLHLRWLLTFMQSGTKKEVNPSLTLQGCWRIRGSFGLGFMVPMRLNHTFWPPEPCLEF